MDWFSSFQYKSTLDGNSIQQQRINDKNNLFLAKFKDSLMYKQVGLGTLTNYYDSWISSEDAWKQLIELKKIELAPNQSNLTSNFFKGQYVYWNNDGQNEVWLIVASDQRVPFNPMAMMKRCNAKLKWVDSNNIVQSYDCTISDKVTRDYLEPNKVIMLPPGHIHIETQRNSVTNAIKLNQRFLFGVSGNYMPFKVEFVENYFDFPYLSLKLYKDEISPNDDLVNGVAGGLNIIPSSTPTTGNYILPIPNITFILQNNTQIYTVNHYLNGTADSNTFTITASGASTSFYTLTVINGNSFGVKSLGYTSTPLIVTCKNNVDATTVQISINLKGLV